jgi:hypothetical protein
MVHAGAKPERDQDKRKAHMRDKHTQHHAGPMRGDGKWMVGS